MMSQNGDSLDDFGEWKPGKLRSRAKKGKKLSQSFMDLPAVAITDEERKFGLNFEQIVPDLKNDESNPQKNDSSKNSSTTSPGVSGAVEEEVPAEAPAEKAAPEMKTRDVFDELIGSEEDSDSENEGGEAEPRPSLALLLRKPAEKSKDVSQTSNPAVKTPSALSSMSLAGNAPVASSVNGFDHLQSLLAQAETLTRNLNENILSIKQAQSKMDRRNILNSAVAYVIFCVIITLGLYFALNNKASMLNYKTKFDEENYRSMQASYQISKNEFEKNQKAAHQAYEVYQLIEQSRYDDAIRRFNEVRAELTHPAELALLEEKIETIRWKLAESIYRQALSLYNEGSYEQARDGFLQSIEYKSITSYTHLLHYYLAMSLFNLGDFEGSRHYFEEALRAELNSEMDASARYNLAFATEKVGDSENAYALYETFIKKYRYHRLSEDAAKRQLKLEQKRKKN